MSRYEVLTSGPMTEPIPNIPLIRPCQIGRFCKGDMYVMMIKTPANKPDAPAPAIARYLTSLLVLRSVALALWCTYPHDQRQ